MSAEEGIVWVPWACHVCGYGKGERIKARANMLIRCVCGDVAWSS